MTQRFFDFGQSDLATNHLYNYDHLGSVREMTNSSSSVQAQYEYNLWGESVKKNGSGNASRRYAGYFVHDPSKLQFAVYRNYSASLGRWLRRDPIEENGGINLYSYVNNYPSQSIDPLGLLDYCYGTNCMGAALRRPAGPNGSVQPSSNESLRQALGKLGYKCRKIAKFCECKKKDSLIAGAVMYVGGDDTVLRDGFDFVSSNMDDKKIKGKWTHMGNFHVVLVEGPSKYMQVPRFDPTGQLKLAPTSESTAFPSTGVKDLYCCEK